MEFERGLIYAILVLAVLWWIGYIGHREKARQARVDRATAPEPKKPIDDSDWDAPTIGTAFEHCGIRMLVVDDFIYGETGGRGVVAHYKNEEGEVRVAMFRPRQWDALRKARA